MTNPRHPLEQVQRGIGFAMFALVLAIIIFSYLDSSERSPPLLFGLPALAALFTAYSIVKFANTRIRIRNLKERANNIQNDMNRGITE